MKACSQNQTRKPSSIEDDMRREMKARRLVPTATIFICTTLLLNAVSAQANNRSTYQPNAQGIATPGLSWNTSATSLPLPLYRSAVATGTNGKVYLFGGSDQVSVFNTTYIYDPVRNRWAVGAPMPTAREGAQAVTLPDGRIAVLGGGADCATNLCSDGTVYSVLEVYTPSANSWMEYPAMNSPRYRFAAVLYNARIYAMGGSDGSSILSSIETFDFGTNTWSIGSSLPQALLSPVAAVDGNGHIDVAGGTDLTSYFNTLYTFDGSSWSSGPSLPQATQDGDAAVGPDGRIYVLGGYTPQTNFLSIVQAFDPRTASWTVTTSLPEPRCCSGTSLANGHLYAFGGLDGIAISQVAIGTVWPAPSLTLAPNSGPAGTTITVRGSSFGVGHTVQIKLYCSSPTCLSHTLLGYAVANISGAFTTTITIPTTTPVGGHEVGAIDTLTNAFAGRTFTVTP